MPAGIISIANIHELRWPTFFGQAPKKLDKKVPEPERRQKTHLQ